MNKRKSSVLVLVLVLAAGFGLLLASGGAFAQSGDANELGNGICKLVGVLTGKFLFGFAILATLGAGAALLFGGEITDGLKKIATIISIVGIILVTSGLLTMAFTKFNGMVC